MASLVEGRFTRSAAAAGASVLLRPEGAILAALMALAVGRKLWRGQAEGRACTLVPVGAWLVAPGAVWTAIATWYYGSPIPQSVVAKRAGLYPMTVGETVAELVRGMSSVFFGTRTPIMALVLLLFLVMAVGAFRLLRAHPDLWVVPAWLVALAGFPYGSVAAGYPVPGDRPFPAGITRHVGYAQLIDEARPALPAGTVFALPEIGLLGFYLDQIRVLDTAGLVSPEATSFFPVPEEQRASPRAGAIPVGLIRQEEPDMVATYEVYGRHGVLADGWFAERYELVRSMDGPWLPPGTGPLMVFARNDFQPGLGLRRPSGT